MMWDIEYDSDAVEVDIPDLPKRMRDEIKKAIEEKLGRDPISFGKPLRYSLKGQRRLRVGDYRIIYKVFYEEKKILITVIKHRKEVYEN